MDGKDLLIIILTEIFNHKKKKFLTISDYRDGDYYSGPVYTFH